METTSAKLLHDGGTELYWANAVCRDARTEGRRETLRHTKPHLVMIDSRVREEARFDTALSHMHGIHAMAVTDARQRQYI